MVAKHSYILGLILGALPSIQASSLFTVQCGPLTIHRGDPIVFPGEISPHVHAIVGGTAFSLGMSNEDARNSDATTCNKMLDKSNYWQPQLYHQDRDGRFEMVEFLGMVRASRRLCIELANNQPSRPPTISTELATTKKAAQTAMALKAPSHLRLDFAWSSATRCASK